MGIKKFLREYFGLIPLTGGLLTAGAVGSAAFLISLLSGTSQELTYVINGKDAVDAISILYQKAGETAGHYIMPSAAVGQFLTYRFKKSVTSFFKKK